MCHDDTAEAYRIAVHHRATRWSRLSRLAQHQDVSGCRAREAVHVPHAEVPCSTDPRCGNLWPEHVRGATQMRRDPPLLSARATHGGMLFCVAMVGLQACTATRPQGTVIEARSPAGSRQNARLCSAPRYPADALQADVEGTTRLLLDVSETGQVLKSTVVRSAGQSDLHKKLDQAAVESFNQCPFQPAKDADGRPMRGPAMVELRWKIEDAPPRP